MADIALDEIFRWVKDLGFPIVVALYVLIRQEPKLTRIDNKLNRLTDIMLAGNKK